MPKITTHKTIKVERIEFAKPKPTPEKNIVPIAISRGKRPLHGTKTFVSIAINLSLGEFIILQPITPTSITPKPHAHACLKYCYKR